MGITDGDLVCSLCGESRTGCSLCYKPQLVKAKPDKPYRWRDKQ
jgi:hypothetical protein